MSEPTSTRKTLRRAICRAARMRFYHLYPDEVALSGSQTTTAIVSSALTQADDYWNNGFVYIVDGARADSEKRVSDFTASSDTLTLEAALAGAPSAGDKIEITEMWPPSTIHQVINRAIEMASRMFINTVRDQTLVLCENKLRYDISGFTTKVYRVNHVWVERQATYYEGVIDTITPSGANSIITDTSLFTTDDAYNTYKISIYSGTGAGSLGTIDDMSSTGTITVTTADFTVTPVAGDKFRIWNENYQVLDLYEVRNMRLDATEYPDTLALEMLMPLYYGCRLWVDYTALPPALTTDAGTTVVPQEYIIRKGLALLHDNIISDNRADFQRHQQLAQYYHSQADEYLSKFYTQRPSGNLNVQSNPGISNELINPLDWHS